MPGFLHTSALVLYPVVVHLSILFEKNQLAFWYLLLVLAWFALERLTLLLRLFVTVSIIVLLLFFDQAMIAEKALYSIPVFICLTLFIFFANTLRAGQTPLITTIAQLTDESLSDSARSYTRKLTMFWCVIFLCMALECLLLATLAPIQVWSLFTNVVNYLVIMLLFILEFFIRRQILPEWRKKSFRQFIQSLTMVRIWND